MLLLFQNKGRDEENHDGKQSEIRKKLPSKIETRMTQKENFNRAYSAIHQSVDLVCKMAGADGKTETFDSADIHKLQKLTREAASAANALNATWEGNSKPSTRP